MQKKFYISAAIPYANSRPHLGHALEIVQADAFARFNRLRGSDVHFQTGMDEHGSKNWESAKKQGKGIMQFLDENVGLFKELYEKLDISYDNLIRTTDKKNHYPGAIKLWEELAKSGDIYKKKYKGLYCMGCEAFKTEKDLEDGRCPNHQNRELEQVEEENYFFRLSKYKDEVAKAIESDDYRIIPQVRKNEILSFLKIAKDISFSRPKTSLSWGIEVPGDEGQVMYVWCDALSNYITAVGYGRDEKKFKQHWPADFHFIGKDILRFHAAFWPAMLICANLPLPKNLFVHGFILSKGKKMGKSTGNVIEPTQQLEKYGIDAFRFYLLGTMPLEGDGEYSEDILRDKINNELAANLGNFCYRVLSFLNKNFEGKIKEVAKDKEITGQINELVSRIGKNYEGLNYNEVEKDILQISSIGNKYFQDSEPWKLIKEDREAAHRVVSLCANIVKNLGIIVSPIMPGFAANLLHQLNVKDMKWKDINFELTKHRINKEEILVRRIEDADTKPQFPLNLRVAKILSAKEHPDADKLYVIEIDLGSEKRQLVAGLRLHYSKEELTGKKIVIVSNLKPAKLRGVVSQGMLLAGDDGTHVGVLTVDKSEPGDAVFLDGIENSDKEITYDEFSKVEIKVKHAKAVVNDSELRTEKEAVRVEKAKDGAKVK